MFPSLPLKQVASPPPNPMTPEMQELLAQLRDIHEPAPIDWWPLAPGWWILAGACIALVFAGAVLALRLRQKQRRNLYRAEGVRLLQALDLTAPRAIEDINLLLKRVAVVTFGREAAGPLTGLHWIQFLESSSEIPLPETVRRAILENLYSNKDGDPQSLKQLREYAIQWVRKHRSEPESTAIQHISVQKKEAEVV